MIKIEEASITCFRLFLLFSIFCMSITQIPPSIASSNNHQILTSRMEFERQIPTFTTIEVTNHFGDIQIKRAPGQTVSIYAVIQKNVYDHIEPDIAIELTEKLSITVKFPTINNDPPDDLNLNRRLDLTLYVPIGSSLILKAGQGKIIGKGLKSDVTAETTDGKIFIRTTGMVNAFSRNGDIGVYFKQNSWSRPLHIESQTGDMMIRMPPNADAAVEIETSGEITTDFSMEIQFLPSSNIRHAIATIASGTHPLQIKSLNGNVKLLKSREDIYTQQ